jgi:serine/threonine protein kinase
MIAIEVCNTSWVYVGPEEDAAEAAGGTSLWLLCRCGNGLGSGSFGHVFAAMDEVEVMELGADDQVLYTGSFRCSSSRSGGSGGGGGGSGGGGGGGNTSSSGGGISIGSRKEKKKAAAAALAALGRAPAPSAAPPSAADQGSTRRTDTFGVLSERWVDLVDRLLMGGPLAMKFDAYCLPLEDDPSFLDGLVPEIVAGRRLVGAAGYVPVYAHGRAVLPGGCRSALLMSRVEGLNAWKWKPLLPGSANLAVKQLFRGLCETGIVYSSRGVSHNDRSGGNVIILPGPNPNQVQTWQVQTIDFGSSKLLWWGYDQPPPQWFVDCAYGSLQYEAPDGTIFSSSCSSSSGRETREGQAGAAQHPEQQPQQQQGQSKQKRKSVGTAWYNSPGQQNGESHGPHTDVWAAAAHLYVHLKLIQYGLPPHDCSKLGGDHRVMKAAKECAPVFAACFVPHQKRWSLRRLLAEFPLSKLLK